MPIEISLPVAWGDMDAYSHVNNTVFLKWCESARIAFFQSIGLERCRAETGIGAILASIQCRYKAPVTYPDTISVSINLLRLGPQDFELSYTITSHQLGRTVAEATDRLVAYDYRQLSKSQWPPDILSRLQSLQSPAP